MARIRIAAIIGGCIMVISGAVLATRGEGDSELPASQSAPVDESISALGDRIESAATEPTLDPTADPDADTSGNIATKSVAVGSGQPSSSNDSPETTMTLDSSPITLGPPAPTTAPISSALQDSGDATDPAAAPGALSTTSTTSVPPATETTTAYSDKLESDDVNSPAAALDTPSTTSREEQVPSQESPTPITVVTPMSTTTTNLMNVPELTCSVTVSTLEVTQPTTSIDRQVMVSTEVESATHIPAVWVEIRWETQVRRTVLELNPYGLGQTIIPAPGTGPVAAKVFIDSDFAELHRRCAT